MDFMVEGKASPLPEPTSAPKFCTWMIQDFRNPRHLLDVETLEEQSDGSAIITVTVNSLNEIASWVAGRGKGITVIEPKELKDKVVDLAQGALSNYEYIPI